MKIANRDARRYVQSRTTFVGSNLFGYTFTDRFAPEGMQDGYAVFSYGVHWPLFIYSHGMWFENEERHSVTTSKHRSQSHPHCPTVFLSHHWMKKLFNEGFQAIAKARILSEVAE